MAIEKPALKGLRRGKAQWLKPELQVPFLRHRTVSRRDSWLFHPHEYRKYYRRRKAEADQVQKLDRGTVSR